jgi:hypothetical protein
VAHWSPKRCRLTGIQDLGLGVLEEKDPDADEISESDSDGSDTEDGGKEKDVLGKLMGREKAKNAVSVQEVA